MRPAPAHGQHAHEIAMAENAENGRGRIGLRAQVQPRGIRGQQHARVDGVRGGRRRRGGGWQRHHAVEAAEVMRLHIADAPEGGFHARPAVVCGQNLHIVAIAQPGQDGGGSGRLAAQVQPRRSVGQFHARERAVGPERRHSGIGRRRGRGRRSGRGRNRGLRRRAGRWRSARPRRGRGSGRRRGRSLRREYQILGFEVAALPGGGFHRRPFAAFFIGGHDVAIAHGGHGVGLRRGAGAQKEPPIGIVHGHHGRTACGGRRQRRGGRRNSRRRRNRGRSGRRRRSKREELRRLRPAAQSFITDARPCAASLVYMHHRAGGHAAQAG